MTPHATWAVLALLTPALDGKGNNLIDDPPPSRASVRLEVVADVGPDRVTDITHAGDGSGRLFLVSPQGLVRIFDPSTGRVLTQPFLDAPASPPDRAMSGLAFHPDYANNGLLYLITGEATPNPSTPHYSPPQMDDPSAFDNVIVEYRVSATDPNQVDPSSRRELLRVHQAHRLHNANDLTFGGDGFLYIAMGDGGTTRAGSPTDHNTTAQQTDNPYGAVLRIDVDTLGTNGRYGIPAGNPFAGSAGGEAREIYAWGFRNPWRIMTDRQTGAVYTASNGDFTIEQLVRVEVGRNYGWDAKEGSFLWDPISGNASVDPHPDPAYTNPLGEYDHNTTTDAFGSCIGGTVYRGGLLPAFWGKYLFTDHVAGALLSMNVATGALRRVPVDPSGAPLMNFQTIVWGEDEGGELYLGRLNGQVLKLVDDSLCSLVASSTLGRGVPGKHGIPMLVASKAPTPDSDVQLWVGNSAGAATQGFLLVGEGLESPVDGRAGPAMRVSDREPRRILAIPSAGGSFPLRVLGRPDSCYQTVFVQVVTVDPAAPGGRSWSAVLELTFGDA